MWVERDAEWTQIQTTCLLNDILQLMLSNIVKAIIMASQDHIFSNGLRENTSVQFTADLNHFSLLVVPNSIPNDQHLGC